MAAETRCRCLKKHDGKNGADHQAQIRDELYRNDRLDVEQMAISVAQLSGFLREELERLCVESRAKHKAAWAAAVRCGAIQRSFQRVRCSAAWHRPHGSRQARNAFGPGVDRLASALGSLHPCGISPQRNRSSLRSACLVVMADDVKLLNSARRCMKEVLPGCRAQSDHQRRRSAGALKPGRHDRTWERYMERNIKSQGLACPVIDHLPGDHRFAINCTARAARCAFPAYPVLSLARRCIGTSRLPVSFEHASDRAGCLKNEPRCHATLGAWPSYSFSPF